MLIHIITKPNTNPALYMAFEIRENVGYYMHHASTNLSDLVAELEIYRPKPIIRFDNAARLAFWHSLQ